MARNRWICEGGRQALAGRRQKIGAALKKRRCAVVLCSVENLATLIDQWLDPIALGIVLGGTLLATLLRCGFAQARLAITKVCALVRPAFDPARAKADLAKQIAAIRTQGILRAEPARSGDEDLDHLVDTLATRRSLEGLQADHERQRLQRTEAAQTAVDVLAHAAELAPVLGLAGTLVALGTMPGGSEASAAGDVGMTGAIAMAVVTTLYGIAAANFLFGPLAAAIQRRSAREERDRQAVLEWLETAVRRTMPQAPARPVAVSGLRKAS